MSESFASDVPISMPEGLTPNDTNVIPMFGFAFTENGLTHDLTASEREELSIPTWAPLNDMGQPEVRGDRDFELGLGR